MATQSLASHNPRRASSEIRDPAKFLRQVDGLGIRPHLRYSFKGYYQVCGSPIGENAECWKGLRKAAREMGINYRTLKRHHREWKLLGLIEFAAAPESDRRSKKWRIKQEQFNAQDWPEGICPRCRHKHADTECGCELTPRHWPKKGWVERRCRCMPRPSENSRRKGPQSVESTSSQVPPASPKPAETAAPTQPSPAATRREHRTVKQMQARPLRSGQQQDLGAMYQRMLALMEKYPPPEQALDRMAAKYLTLNESAERKHQRLDWRGCLGVALRDDCPHVPVDAIVRRFERMSQEIRGHGLKDEETQFIAQRPPLEVPRTKKQAVEFVCLALSIRIDQALEHLRETGHEVPDEEGP